MLLMADLQETSRCCLLILSRSLLLHVTFSSLQLPPCMLHVPVLHHAGQWQQRTKPAKVFISDLLWRPPEAAICNAAECCGLARRPRCCRLWSDLHEFHFLTPSPPPRPTPSFYHFTWAMQCSDMGSICHTPPPLPSPPCWLAVK